VNKTEQVAEAVGTAVGIVLIGGMLIGSVYGIGCFIYLMFTV
jgi:hypothetical protein